MMNVSVNYHNPTSNMYAGLEYGIAAEIIQQINEIYYILAKASVPVRPFTPKAIQALKEADEIKKLRILQDLTNWKNILVSANVGIEKVDEKQLAAKALKYFNFRLKDHDWLETCGDQIIEIYNPEGIQLYRSLNFFNTCGYSLLDLCVNEWFVLWERPKAIIQRIHDVVGQVLTGTKTDTAVGIGPHLIRETFDDGTTQPFQPRTAIVEFCNVCPTYSNDLKNNIIGFVITSRGKLVSVGEEATAIDFI
ncbi:hypothetical protein [Bdellovibrio sp. HCB337]|uniref:hypothetical protein n=1 Tax=Bdellovibrio sp. HCB337 TaxID=3394358 RepID=UPI0039A567C6